MQDILNQFIEFESLLPATIGFVLGGLVIGLVFLLSRQKLMTQNAELKAQMREREIAYNKASADMDARFKMTANEALRQNNEQFMALAQEKLKAAQSDSSHDPFQSIRASQRNGQCPA